MKIILSRKGFDSTYGEVPSPIFEDGSMLSIPIPADSKLTYDDLSSKNSSGSKISNIVEDLTSKKGNSHVKGNSDVHLDPDLNPDSYPRSDGWKPMFGTSGAAQGHLVKQGVGIGDLFLFFGWFREVINKSGRYEYKKSAEDKHVIFGWLQVGSILHPQTQVDAIPEWAKYHPHCEEAQQEEPGNCLYIASDQLQLGDIKGEFPGGGVFKTYKDHPLCLTKKGQWKRSLWELPEWFYPDADKPPLSYHTNVSKRWSKADGYAILQSVARGQEFVFDTDHYPEAIGWLESIFNS